MIRLPHSSAHPASSRNRNLALLVLLPALLAAILSYVALNHLLPSDQWWQSFRATDLTDPNQLIFRYSALPRLFIAPLVGAALGLTGTILQQVLRNPLAEPTTVGTNAGASLAIVIATLYAPWMLETGREWVALAGGTVTTAIVFMLAKGRSFSPVTMIIAGLIISLTCSSASSLLMALNREYSEELFIWQSGSLVQNGGDAIFKLLPWVVGGLLASFALLRPLLLLELDDESTQSLGSRPTLVRLSSMFIAVVLSTMVVASVGVISFIALAAPAVVRMCGARTLRQRLTWAPLAGASLLWLTDRLVQMAPFPSEVPTGTATALFGAPLLLLLLIKLRPAAITARPSHVSVRTVNTRLRLGMMLGLLILVLVVVFMFGRSAGGWYWLQPSDVSNLLDLRGPRTLTALGTGMMLALAGTLMQRMTGNAMAAPEVLGVSGGATVGVLAVMLLTSGVNRSLTFTAAAAGALATLFMLLFFGRQKRFSADRQLLAGVCIATISSSIAAVFIAGGDQRIDFLLAWMSGSTYHASPMDAVVAIITAVLLLAIIPLTARWLDILPLGGSSARALGVNLPLAHVILMLLAAIPAGIATLLIGPLSFVGLMAPHLARFLGFQRAIPQLFASAVIGGLILVSADWMGRTLIFPWQIPAGLLAAFAGGPYFMVLMLKDRR
ncbi:Fe(3+)-hydroxamate ABC transporter permease FhuB [Phyllobacterium myrsinacearum]|uniref:Iron complex transport system permease protein n=1 Tax=Phyllobacterium myrsinacearum TaxID=28101 RepID=A0A839EFU1_9HYPH|nr:Fe(3+)-hydroxamate ABC transporter permease FhuB [Phyllobacterium myrsinacearum]MBA8879013.1 iron complex transport system permease protein [Phyllobacterium myrsinacearum]